MNHHDLFSANSAAIENYSEKRSAASEFLDIDGMEEAVIDELKERGYRVEEED
jgi:hypothetical protein